MNYYEELGVRPDAPLEDIRQAYRQLARLLHPDTQIEPDLKPVAQRQMQRLLGMIDVLSNPAKRARYDQTLTLSARFSAPSPHRAAPPEERPASLAAHPRIARFVRCHWFWLLNGACVMILGAWTLLQNRPGIADQLPSGSIAQPDSPSELLPPPANPGRRNLSPRPFYTPPSPARSSSKTAPRVPFLPPPAPLPPPESEVIPTFPPDLPEAPKQTPEPVPQAARRSSDPSFAGRWLYVPDPGEAPEGGVYSAAYIELLLVEHAGEISGEYHARYNVPDRALSPEVRFHIRGRAEPPRSKFTWFSSDNAKGEAELVLRGANVLYMSWWTTAFGPHPALGSGTAILIRLQPQSALPRALPRG